MVSGSFELTFRAPPGHTEPGITTPASNGIQVKTSFVHVGKREAGE